MVVIALAPNKMKTSLRIHNYKPICYIYNKLLVARKNKFYICSLDFKNLSLLFEIPSGKTFLPSFSLIERIYRLSSAIGVFLKSEQVIVVLYMGSIYSYNLKCRALTKEFSGFLGKPFNLSVAISSGHEWVLFGDYPPSVSYNDCAVYRRLPYGRWDVVYRFPPNIINHIHNVQQSLDGLSYYVMTGDFSHASAIWRLSADFKSITLLTQHGQCSRACWVFEHDGRLYYSSDTQADINYMYSCSASSFQVPIRLFPVFGPSINFHRLSDSSFVFSTSVEPASCEKMSFLSLFDPQLAPGVLTPFSYVYHFSILAGCQIIHKARKDLFPMRLFQFGDIKFPSGLNPDPSCLHCYEQSCQSGGSAKLIILH